MLYGPFITSTSHTQLLLKLFTTSYYTESKKKAEKTLEHLDLFDFSNPTFLKMDQHLQVNVTQIQD